VHNIWPMFCAKIRLRLLFVDIHVWLWFPIEQTLTELDLSHNLIGDTGADRLFSALHKNTVMDIS
jgi:hypothetical protein